MFFEFLFIDLIYIRYVLYFAAAETTKKVYKISMIVYFSMLDFEF